VHADKALIQTKWLGGDRQTANNIWWLGFVYDFNSHQRDQITDSRNIIIICTLLGHVPKKFEFGKRNRPTKLTFEDK
jgi:hypothetical protein